MRDVLYDTACETLARHFLGERADQKTVAALAAHIQTTIEDWIAALAAQEAAPPRTARRTAAMPSEPSLSDDARQVAGGLFGMGSKTKVTFAMVENRPTARCQAGLDELVAAGLITRRYIDGGGVEYTGSEGCHEHFKWMMHQVMQGGGSLDPIQVSEPIAGARSDG